MVILGIDPGMAITGYGVIESDKNNNKMKVLDYGVVTTPSDMETSQRLLHIFNSVEELIRQYSPDAIAYEELFFNKNVKTALIIDMPAVQQWWRVPGRASTCMRTHCR